MASTKDTKGIINWIDYRLPVVSFLKHSAVDYPTPKLKLLVELWFTSWLLFVGANYHRSNFINALYCARGSCF